MNRTHKLEIDWFSDRRTWAVGIWLVHRQNATILLNRVLESGIRRSADETKRKIAAMLDGDDDNIALDQLKISLLCPLMKTRMKIPARTKTCSHLQCFDLLNYLDMNEKRPTWKCPQCNGNAHFDDLIIDQYFMDMLKAVEHNVEEVELSRDGNWKILEVAFACEDLSDDDDDGTATKTVKVEETSSTKTNNKSTKKDDEIITLDDSDDDNNPGSSEPAASRSIPFPSSVSTNFSSEAPTPPRTPLTTNGSNVVAPAAKSSSTTATSGPQAKQGRLNDDNSSTRSTGYRRSRSSSSSSEASSDSGHPRRRKIPAAIRGYRRSRSSSSSSEASSDSGHPRRRKIPAANRGATNGKPATPSASSTTAAATSKNVSKKVNESEIITLDSSDDEESMPRPARITQSSSRSNSYAYSNGTNGSTDSNPPQTNGTTNGTSASTSATKRPNGVHSDVAQKNNQISSNNLTEAIEYEVADGLTQFINSVFLRDTRGPSTFTAS
uniref:SP-RING-type domain-containing protein n=1 Tax=Panagrolaimus sp. ES5 TaxID=591445 RepID=A0AC34FGX9_9BILA